MKKALKPSLAQQRLDIVSDLLRDAEQSEAQAKNGPYYPNLDVTEETLLQYAGECRKLASRKDWTVDQFIKGNIN